MHFLPNGFVGVIKAMGLTFIAFEGYEIIAQSGEEVIDPDRNIPRAIIYSDYHQSSSSTWLVECDCRLALSMPPAWDEGVGLSCASRKRIAVVEVAQPDLALWALAPLSS